jgi:hypothetical protein
MTLQRTIPASAINSLCQIELRAVTFVHGMASVLCGSSNATRGKAFLVDLSNSQVVAVTPNLSDPWQMLPTTDESQLLVGEFGFSNVSIIDTRTNTVRFVGKLAPSGVGSIRAAPITTSSSLTIDTPSVGSSTTLAQPFDVAGWSIDAAGFTGPGIDAVHVWAIPSNGAAPKFLGMDFGQPRADIQSIYGSLYLNSGFSVTARGLAPGAYQLAAFAHSSRTNSFSLVRAINVTVATSPRLAIDVPADGAVQKSPVTVAGWAADLASSSGVGIDAVHVWVFPTTGSPIFAGVATLGLARQDVAALYGAQFVASGYALTLPALSAGNYVIAALAHSTLTGAFSIAQTIHLTITP